MKHIFAALCTLFLLQPTLAHEGHETPGVVKSIHGGTALAGKEINLEYLISGNEVTLYPVSHEGQDLKAADVKISATAKTPKGKAETLKLEAKDNAYIAQVDFKNAHRVEVVVTTVSAGKKDTFKFQVEK